MLRIAKKRQNLQRILKKLNRIMCDRLKYCIIRSKHITNYTINNYNKINIKKFKDIIAFTKQELLKVEIKNYF